MFSHLYFTSHTDDTPMKIKFNGENDSDWQ